MIMLLLTAFLSERINSRVIATVVLQLWALPLLIALYTFTSATSDWVYYAVVTLITGFPYVHPIRAYNAQSFVRRRSCLRRGGLGIAEFVQCTDQDCLSECL